MEPTYSYRWPIVVHSKCQVCGGSKLRSLYSVEQDDFSYVMMLCKNCNHVQVGRTQFCPGDKQESKDYFSNFDGDIQGTWAGIDRCWGGGRLRAFNNILGHLKSLGFTGKSMIDVGCAFGHFLNLARKHGYSSVFGVDPSPLARLFAQEKFGIKVVEHIDSIPKACSPFDVIVCAETLYYCHDVRDTIGKMKNLLKPKGCLVLKIRSNRTGLFCFAALLTRLRGDLLQVRPGSYLWHYCLRSYHLFTTRNIHRLLQSMGFEVLKTVNEKQVIPSRLTATGFAKLIRIVWTTIVSAVTFGTVKIGTEITVYATPSRVRHESQNVRCYFAQQTESNKCEYRV